MPITQSDIELAQVKTFLEARGWTVIYAGKLQNGLRIDAHRAPVQPPYDTGPLKDLNEPPPKPRG